MNSSLAFILLSLGVLLVVAIFVFFLGRNRTENRLTPLAGLAFGFILAGILFGEARLIGYSLMGVGVIVALVDILNRSKSK
ncbi:MAG: hypothetical protein A2Y88_03490 [Chloroflexi bacterium RBG_13_48_10]|nr:MAG: hypothetical protein A2Y88_03490 [Chloroflexi bacterium RBG_13_48_10]